MTDDAWVVQLNDCILKVAGMDAAPGEGEASDSEDDDTLLGSTVVRTASRSISQTPTPVPAMVPMVPQPQLVYPPPGGSMSMYPMPMYGPPPPAYAMAPYVSPQYGAQTSMVPQYPS